MRKSSYSYTPGQKDNERVRADEVRAFCSLCSGWSDVGVAWAAGPYAGKGWGTGVMDTLVKVGKLIEPIARSIKLTLPSTSYPTVSGKTINDLSWGVATRSLDNKLEYIHVLKNMKDKVLILPAPEDGKLFRSAILLRNGKNESLKQTEKRVELTLPDDESWDAFDTVIRLTVSGTVPVKSNYLFELLIPGISYSPLMRLRFIPGKQT